MKIALGADHRGLAYKERIKGILEKMGHTVIDMGPFTDESVDYPDFGLKVAHAVADKSADRGVTICWTGNGMNMAANKVRGVRAGMAISVDMAYYTRLHNDANVLTLSDKYTPKDQLEEILKTFLETEFEGGRHIARIKKIDEAER